MQGLFLKKTKGGTFVILVNGAVRKIAAVRIFENIPMADKQYPGSSGIFIDQGTALRKSSISRSSRLE